MVTNVRSLAPKIDEVREFMMENEINLSFLTETWLNDSITDSVVSIPGFTIIRKDRSINNHGGICIYIRDGDTKLKILSEISCCSEHEILWLHIKPRRLPREFSSIIVAVLYHPPQCRRFQHAESLISDTERSRSKILQLRYYHCRGFQSS